MRNENIFLNRRVRGELYLAFLLLLFTALLLNQQLKNTEDAKKPLQSIDVYKEMKHEQVRNSLS